MKIVIFNDEKEVLNIIDNLKDAKPYGLKEVSWLDGGARIENNYVILEEEQNFEDLTDEDILEQKKYQTTLQMAIELENNKIYSIANGTIEADQADFEEAKTKINNAKNRESVLLPMQAFRNKRNDRANNVKEENKGNEPIVTTSIEATSE